MVPIITRCLLLSIKEEIYCNFSWSGGDYYEIITLSQIGSIIIHRINQARYRTNHVQTRTKLWSVNYFRKKTIVISYNRFSPLLFSKYIYIQNVTKYGLRKYLSACLYEFRSFDAKHMIDLYFTFYSQLQFDVTFSSTSTVANMQVQ